MPRTDPVLKHTEVSEYLTKNKMMLNKNELDNLFYHFQSEAGDFCVDIEAFLSECCTNDKGVDPVWYDELPESEHTAHLALSGVSHTNFGVQNKAFPKHWGAPPNMQMKGHDGVVRDLPGGYGRGNAPMFNW
eukprot:CAMPEP_0115852074 /NCGR_PEP_ID=MMETSP0287-20121206/12808_1 /TAXON_ID=412157 /ORGANISM="Chrysochromulina rotalis, Strain UIO044" /LENGTH=131 /DNA_ID=CAMNT_0003306123 /DNA_START=138 /DNA_END=530 /DNA_ORIENTATION=+